MEEVALGQVEYVSHRELNGLLGAHTAFTPTPLLARFIAPPGIRQ
jgi:hypothetical protein